MSLVTVSGSPFHRLPLSGTSPLPERQRRVTLLKDLALGAAAVALLAALVQTVGQLGQVFFAERVMFVTRDVAWMAPLSWLVWCGAVSLPFLAIGFAWPRRAIATMGVGVLVGLAVFAMMLRFHQIATWACALVSLGVGVRCGSLVHASDGAWRRWARGAVAGAAAASALLSGMMSLSGSPEVPAKASAPGAPNVLLVVIDVVRAANLSSYGYNKATSPNQARLAREGMLVERAYATASWTLPSHATMFTGVFPPAVGVDFRRGLPKGMPTLAEVLGDRGYATGGFTANEVYTAWDARVNRGFHTWKDYQRTPLQTLLSGWPFQIGKVHDALMAKGGLRKRLGGFRYGSWRTPVVLYFDSKIAATVADEFLSWQEALPRDRPFFAFLNMFDAHVPRHAPAEYLQRMGGGATGRDRYDAAILYMDSEIQRIVDTLRSRGELDNTVLAVVGDHGELFGEHGVWGHASSGYRDVLWVPTLVRFPPRIPPGTRVREAVSLRDLPATLLDLAGYPGELPGYSLLQSQRSPSFSYTHQGVNVSTGLPNAKGPVVSVVVDTMLYIRHPDGAEFLFDVVADSAEARNLISNQSVGETVARARHLADSLSRDPAKRVATPGNGGAGGTR